MAASGRIPPTSVPTRVAAVTISDVARVAGVSTATVSKALNGRSDVSAATRSRVEAVARDLGFSPNPLARSLFTGRSFSVGLMTTDSYGRFSIPLLLGAEDGLMSGDVAVMFCDSRDDGERERRQLKALLTRHVDGIIVNGRRTEPRRPLSGSLGVPVVYAFCASADAADCSVVPDEAGGAAQAVDHLVSTGRRRIAHATGPRRHRSAAVRARAARARARAAGIRLVGDVRFGTWSEQWGRTAAAALVQDVPDLDAVFCGSDQIARGVIDGLRAAGRRIPDDVAVVGFDNWDAMALGCEPPLTTIDMNIGEIGRRAARYLLDAIDGAPHPGTTVVDATLVIRGSAP